HVLEGLVDLVRCLLVRAAGAHQRRGQGGEPRLRGRIEHPARLEIDGGVDQRQLVVLEQVDQETVRQEELLRFRERDRQRWIGQGARVRRGCRDRRGPRRRGQKE